MIPRKAKQAVLSLVTTEQSKYGPTRSTQSTVSGGDWGESSLTPSESDHQQTQGTEPNSAASGQDPWMAVTGSGSSYLCGSHSHGNLHQPGIASSEMSSSASTPMSGRVEQISKLPPLQLLDRYEDTDPVLDLEAAHLIRLELPRKLRNATKWNLVYSSDQHGISMTTLYHRCKGKGPMILAIKDTMDCVFGAFVNQELAPHLSYYGTGECFLWNVTTMVASPQPPPSPSLGPSPLPSPSPLRLSSNAASPYTGLSLSSSPMTSSSSASRGNNSASAGDNNRRHDLFVAMNDPLTTGGRSPSPSPLLHHHQQQQQTSISQSSSPTLRPTTPSSGQHGSNTGKRKKKQKAVQFWKWTGKNDYMILSEPGFIGFGGGDGKFGLWIHSDLEIGHSSRCATFDNEPLATACLRPIRPVASSEQEQQQKQMNDAPGSRSRSSSPKNDEEEFYCQTVEIWSMAL
ncbi:oxidation resistance protein 1 [Gamsiella multidivaricata]|nr:oxidation resistance protein 1 [Gamsiella multidivaricata]